MIEKVLQVNKTLARAYNFGSVRKYNKGEVLDKSPKARPLEQDYFQINLPRYSRMYTKKEIKVLASELLALARD